MIATVDAAPPSGRGIQSSVLALNRFYTAVHVVSVRRAFCLLAKGMAEVVHVEDGAWVAFDFDAWLERSRRRRAAQEAGDDSAPEAYPIEPDDWIRSVAFDVQVPRILRLLHYDRVPRNAVRFSRRNVFLRDENRCQYCRRVFTAHQLSLDHVIPRSRGGTTAWDNIVTACRRCNTRKGGRTPGEAGMSLHQIPFRPTRNPVLSYQLTSTKYASWRVFVQ